MKTREDAIAYLKQRGFHAAKRDWVMGETILVAKSRYTNKDGIGCLERAYYLHPLEGDLGGWGLYDCNCGDTGQTYSDLASAVQAVETTLSTPPKALAPMSVSESANAAPSVLFPRHDLASAEGTAKQLLWAMDAVLRWDAPHPRTGKYVFRSNEEMAAIWRSHGGGDIGMPVVDFTQDMVVAVFVDEGTYNEAPSVRRVEERDDVLEICTGKYSRPWQMINPASVIRLPRVDKPLRWVRM